MESKARHMGFNLTGRGGLRVAKKARCPRHIPDEFVVLRFKFKSGGGVEEAFQLGLLEWQQGTLKPALPIKLRQAHHGRACRHVPVSKLLTIN